MHFHQAWELTPVIQALEKWRQEGQDFKAILEFKTSLSYESPYLRKQTESDMVQRVRRLLPSLAELSAQDLQSGKTKRASMVL